jgi:hypothetical protein
VFGGSTGPKEARIAEMVEISKWPVEAEGRSGAGALAKEIWLSEGMEIVDRDVDGGPQPIHGACRDLYLQKTADLRYVDSAEARDEALMDTVDVLGRQTRGVIFEFPPAADLPERQPSEEGFM